MGELQIAILCFVLIPAGTVAVALVAVRRNPDRYRLFATQALEHAPAPS
jgi:hypothetical protein